MAITGFTYSSYKSNFKVGDYVCCKNEYSSKVFYFTAPYKILHFHYDDDDNQYAVLDKDIPGVTFPSKKELFVLYLQLHTITYRVKKLKRILNEN
jgi:hypothetical protein